MSPDGRRLVFVSDGQLWMRLMNRIEATPIPGTEDARGPFFSPEGEWLAFFTTDELRKVAISGGGSVPVADFEAGNRGTWGPGDLVVFGRSGPGDLYQVSANGGTPEPVVERGDYNDVDFPDVLPGGEWVIFGGQPAAGASGGELHILAQSLITGESKILLGGSGFARYASTGHLVYEQDGRLFAVGFDPTRVEITGTAVPLGETVLRGAGRFSDASFAISPGGTIAYVPGTGGGDAQLGWVDDNGDIERIDLPSGDYRHPRVSPDGRWLAFELGAANGQDIYVYESAGNTQPIRLTEGGNNGYPVWSRDGEYVAFQSGNEGDGGIFRRRADGPGPVERLTTPGPDSALVPEAWSPTEDLLAYSVRGTDLRELRLLNLADGTSERFGQIEGMNATVFSPNGEWLAYTQSVRGLPTVWVHSLSDPGTRYQIGQTADGAHHPLWTRDGDRLLYFPLPGSPLVVDIQTEPNFGYGPPVPVPGLPDNASATTLLNHDAAPDGRFVTVLPEGADGAGDFSVIVVLNWFEEFKERVPVP